MAVWIGGCPGCGRRWYRTSTTRTTTRSFPGRRASAPPSAPWPGPRAPAGRSGWPCPCRRRSAAVEGRPASGTRTGAAAVRRSASALCSSSARRTSSASTPRSSSSGGILCAAKPCKAPFTLRAHPRVRASSVNDLRVPRSRFLLVCQYLFYSNKIQCCTIN